jgi:glutamate racemase
LKVGVFDSGVGGLTVVKSLLEQKLFKEIIYFGDTARVPYGVKDKNTIIRYAVEALEFFKNFDIDILVIACNTVSAYALERLVQEADIPVVGVINPGAIALQNAFDDRDTNILVIGTKATVKSGNYETLLKQEGYKNITSIPTGLFVPIVEEGIFEGEVLDATMKYYFKDVKNIDAIILGCTHFPLIEKKISEYFGGAKCIHSGDAIVEYLQKNYNCDKNFERTSVQFFASDNPDGLKNVAREWLGDLLNE